MGLHGADLLEVDPRQLGQARGVLDVLVAKTVHVVGDAVDGAVVVAEGVEAQEGEGHAGDGMHHEEGGEDRILVALEEGDDLHCQF